MKWLRDRKDRYFELLSSLTIDFISYNSFADLLRAEMAALGSSPSDQVYCRLLTGMIREFERRKLITRADAKQ